MDRPSSVKIGVALMLASMASGAGLGVFKYRFCSRALFATGHDCWQRLSYCQLAVRSRISCMWGRTGPECFCHLWRVCHRHWCQWTESSRCSSPLCCNQSLVWHGSDCRSLSGTIRSSFKPLVQVAKDRCITCCVLPRTAAAERGASVAMHNKPLVTDSQRRSAVARGTAAAGAVSDCSRRSGRNRSGTLRIKDRGCTRTALQRQIAIADSRQRLSRST
jgi:hypothetical protein